MYDCFFAVGPCNKCSSESISKLTAAECEDELKLYIKDNCPVKLSDIDYGICCNNCGHVMSIIEKYKDEYKPENQRQIDGICINPKQRWLFDALANNLRPFEEHQDWFQQPYIVTYDYRPSDDSYESFVERMKGYADYQESESKIESKAEWTTRTEQQKTSFFEKFPSGTRFDVRCYDGGAWDRSTAIGWAGSMEQAISIAKAYLN